MSKWLALVFMIIDHTAIVFDKLIDKDIYIIMRLIGRLSFPLFVYFLILGLNRTSNLNKYLTRIFIFGILTEFIQNMTLTHVSNSSLNVLFSMTLYGLLYTIFNDNLKIRKYMKLPIIALLLIMVSFVEYSYSGLLIFIGITYVNNSKFHRKQLLSSIVIFVSFLPGIILGSIIPIQLFASLSGLLMFTPSLEKRVLNCKLEKWVFYWTYPVQWIIFDVIIYILKQFI